MMQAFAPKQLAVWVNWPNDHLSDLELGQLKAACHHLLGVDEDYEWDRAFIVRKEAEEALAYI